jgi:hypothetical protein
MADADDSVRQGILANADNPLCSALAGQGLAMFQAPRALPWAGMLLPLRDEIPQTAALPLCPKGAFTDQPRATPWVFNAKTMRIALKGPDNDARHCWGTLTISAE